MKRRAIDKVQFVDHDDIGKLDLLHHQFGDGPTIVCSCSLATFGKRVGANYLAKEIVGVDNRNHRVKFCDIT